MNFSPFFAFLNYLKTLHWLAKSYSHHKVLDEAYSDFSDKIDEFVESCIGINFPKNYEDTKVAFEMPDSDEEVSFLFESAFDNFMTAINKYANRPELDSLVDDLNNLANKTVYLLRMS